MQELLRLWLSWKGVAVEPGVELRLELSAFPTGGLALLCLLGILAALLLVGLVYRREGRALPRNARVVLGTLRALAVLGVLLLLLEPNVVTVKREVRPGHVLLLADASQSMAHRDTFRRESSQPLAAGWRDLGVADPGAQRRIDLLRALLRHGDGELCEALAANNELHAYTFDAAAQPLAPADGDKFEAVGRHSNPGGAMRTALERSRDAAIAAVVLLSDGRRNLGPQGQEVARLLAQRRVGTTLVLPIGDPAETQVVEVSRIDAPEKVFQKDPFRIGAALRAQGYDSVAVQARLVQTPPGGGTGQVVQTKTVQLGGEQTEAIVEFTGLLAEQPGSQTWAVEIEPPSGEPAQPEKHKKQVQIEALAEQTRVLLISGGPSHEYRILRNQLVRDQTIEVACWLSSADADFPQDGDVSLKALPIDRKEIDRIDVFVLLDPDTSRLTREFCELAARHIVEDGAGLWWCCGEKYTLEALRESASTRALSDLLPVVPDLQLADHSVIGFGRAFPRGWPYQVTPDGGAHQVTRLLDSKETSALLWPRLPSYHFAFPVARGKPAALTLLTQGNPATQRAEGPMPLLAAQFVGAGRVMFLATDETYRWRSVAEFAYDRFWVKGIRFLFEGRLNAGNSRLRIRVGENKLELGDATKVTVDAKDEAFKPLPDATLELQLLLDGGAGETIALRQVEGAPGQFEAQIRPRATGFYRLRPVRSFGRESEATLQVVQAETEREGPVDLAELTAIASAPGGALLSTPRELLDAVRRIPSLTATDVFKTPHAIWDSWLTVVLLLGVLAAEWLLRKRSNLL